MAAISLESEIQQMLDLFYRSLATSNQQCGFALPSAPPPAFYAGSPLARQFQTLIAAPAAPATPLRTIAAFLHQCPPRPAPLPLPDWFWLQMPRLTAVLLATGQWRTYSQAGRQVDVSYQHILDLSRRGILLCLYAPRPNQSDRHCRYVWQPDLAMHFAADDGLPDRQANTAVASPSERS
jgi:hypothetical protein